MISIATEYFQYVYLDFFSLRNEISHNIIVFESRSPLAFLPENPIIPL
jgi:hypothetical protein